MDKKNEIKKGIFALAKMCINLISNEKELAEESYGKIKTVTKTVEDTLANLEGVEIKDVWLKHWLEKKEEKEIDNKTKTVYVVGINWVDERYRTKNKYYENKFKTFIYGVYEFKEVAKAVAKMITDRNEKEGKNQYVYIEKKELNAIPNIDLKEYLEQNPQDYKKVVALSDAIQHNDRK